MASLSFFQLNLDRRIFLRQMLELRVDVAFLADNTLQCITDAGTDTTELPLCSGELPLDRRFVLLGLL